MAYSISLVEGAPDFTSLPVVKITEYPLAKGIYQPYAHVASCMNPKELCLRLLSFEAISIPESQILAAFAPPEEENLLVIRCGEASGEAYALLEGAQVPVDARFHFFRGEDLQGKYWGADVRISLEELDKIFPADCLKKGGRLQGNFYKICLREPYVHLGSAYPCDFQKRDFITKKAMADFIVADY